MSEGLGTAEVSVLLTDDLTICDLNRTYRGVEMPTDVLSFSQEDSGSGAPELPGIKGRPELLGDVVISVETAARQSERHGIAPERELALLAVHGLLHLLGHEDETEQGAARMRSREFDIVGVALGEPAEGD
jgi:probable rRNA maturation factor